MSLSAATNRLIIRRLTRQRKAYCHLLRVSYGTETCGVVAGALKFHVRASAWPRDRAIISPAENIHCHSLGESSGPFTLCRSRRGRVCRQDMGCRVPKRLGL